MFALMYANVCDSPFLQKKQNQIPRKNRPEKVDHWVHNRRNYNKVPVVLNASEFGATWRYWWLSVQPDWGGSAWPLAHETKPGQDWGIACHASSCAIFLFIIALGWWLAAAENAAQVTEAMDAVTELDWVLQQFLQSPQQSSEEASEKDVGDLRPTKRHHT